MSQQKAQLVNPIENLSFTGGIVVSGATTAGNFIGSFSGTATGLSGTPNLNIGVITATAFYGDGSNLTGVAGSTFVGQSTTSQSPTTTIDLSLGNVIYFTHNTDTTVAFANTSTTDSVTFIRTKDNSATARSITWPTSVYWNGGSTPTLINSSQPNDAQIFNLLTRDSGVTWWAHEEVSYSPLPPYELWMWGSNTGGSLGQNDVVNYSSPRQIPGTQWNFGSGVNATFSIKTNNTLWTWGVNSSGQLGLNNTVNRSSPHQIPGTQWVYTTASDYIFSRKTDGTLWAWATNARGELGLNDTVTYSSPRQIPGTQWNFISRGFYRAGYGIKTDGTLWAWGSNYNADLGLNTLTTPGSGISSPTQIPGTQWSYVTGGQSCAMAIKTDGTLWAWGAAGNGRLGLNSLVYRSSPTQIPGTQWNLVVGSNLHMLAKKTDGTLWLWGYNTNGQLGLNNTVNRSSPHQIPGTQWNLISSGSDQSLATKTDGTLWVWSNNDQSQLGLNDVVPRSSPTQVPGTQWTFIGSMSGNNTLALKS
jgi:alpha-tubulin suppressor-like RCC1 family protein